MVHNLRHVLLMQKVRLRFGRLMRCILDKDDINCDSHNTAVAYSKASLSKIKLWERCKIKKILKKMGPFPRASPDILQHWWGLFTLNLDIEVLYLITWPDP